MHHILNYVKKYFTLPLAPIFIEKELRNLEIALDGLSALNSTKKSINYLHASQSYYNLPQDIRNRVKLLPEEINIRWRQGYECLYFWVVMNDKADNHAKSYLCKCIKHKTKNVEVRHQWRQTINIM